MVRAAKAAISVPFPLAPPQHRRLMGIAAIACLILQLGATLPRAAAALGVWIFLLAISDRGSLRRLWRPRFWAFTIVLALASGLLLGPHRGTASAPQVVSLVGLQAGLMMLLRGAFIFALVTWASRALSGKDIQRLTARLGLPGLGLAIATGISLLPSLTRELQRTLSASPEDPPSPISPATAATSWVCRSWLGRAWRSTLWIVSHTAHLADTMAQGDMLGERPDAHERTEAPRKTPLLTAVVGDRGAGKTTLVTALAERLQREGIRVGGVIQRMTLVDDRARSYTLVDIASGETHLLAWRNTPDQAGFSFDPEGWTWARRHIVHACESDHVDVLVVDELGRLEAEGDGHLPALEAAIRSATPAALLLSIRSDCVEAIAARLGALQLTISPGRDAADEAHFVARLRELIGDSPAAPPPQTDTTPSRHTPNDPTTPQETS